MKTGVRTIIALRVVVLPIIEGPPVKVTELAAAEGQVRVVIIVLQQRRGLILCFLLCSCGALRHCWKLSTGRATARFCESPGHSAVQLVKQLV